MEPKESFVVLDGTNVFAGFPSRLHADNFISNTRRHNACVVTATVTHVDPDQHAGRLLAGTASCCDPKPLLPLLIDAQKLQTAFRVAPWSGNNYLVAFSPPGLALQVGDEVRMIETPPPHRDNVFLRLCDQTVHAISNDQHEYVLVVDVKDIPITGQGRTGQPMMAQSTPESQGGACPAANVGEISYADDWFIALGTRVQLRSGGPIMTVVGHTPSTEGGEKATPVVECCWWREPTERAPGAFDQENFPAESLDLVNPSYGLDQKYGKVTVEHGTITPGEPVFLLRAQDSLAVETIYEYGRKRLAAGDKEGAAEVDRATRKMALWPVKKFPT